MTNYDKLNVKKHWKEKADDKDRYLLCNDEYDIDLFGIANDLHIQIDVFKKNAFKYWWLLF